MSLKKTQLRILKLLSLNCRFTNKDIAKSIGISPDQVAYQINKLVGKHKHASFFIQFDYRQIGFRHFHYLLRFEDPQQADLQAILAVPGITFINTMIGNYDIQLILVAREEYELMDTLAQIRDIIKGNLQEYVLLEFQHQYKYTTLLPDHHVPALLPRNQKNPLYRLTKPSFHVGKTETTRTLDKKDKAIIKQLIANPRIGFLQIARNTGLNHETVRQRINRYAKERFITTFSVWNDYAKYGYYANILFLKTKDLDEKRYQELIRQNPHIFYSAKLLGQYNLILYLVTKTPHEFAKHAKEIRQFLGDKVISMELLYFDRLLKNVQFPQTALT